MSLHTLRNSPRPAPYKPSKAVKVKKAIRKQTTKIKAAGKNAGKTSLDFGWSGIKFIAAKIGAFFAAVWEFITELYSEDPPFFILIATIITLVIGVVAALILFNIDLTADTQHRENKAVVAQVDKELNNLATNDKYWDKFVTDSDKKRRHYISKQISLEGAEVSYFNYRAVDDDEAYHHDYLLSVFNQKEFDDVYLCHQKPNFGMNNDDRTCYRWRRLENGKITKTEASGQTLKQALQGVKWHTDLEGVFVPFK